MTQVHYPAQNPISTGLKARCPRCGDGALLSGLLTVKDKCTACGLDYKFNDAGDGPTVFVMMILGFIILGAALAVDLSYSPAFWVHVVLWVPLTFGLGIPVLRAIKGVLIALTYKNDAGQGRLDKSQNKGSNQ